MPEKAEPPRGNNLDPRPSHRLTDPEAGRTQFLVGPRRSAGIRERQERDEKNERERVRENATTGEIQAQSNP